MSESQAKETRSQFKQELQQVLDQHKTRLRQRIHRMLETIPAEIRPVLDIEDAWQEVCKRAHTSPPKLDEEFEKSVYRWLCVIVDSVARDKLRQFKSKKRGNGLRQQNSPAAGNSGSMVDLIQVIAAGGKSPSSIVGQHFTSEAIEAALAALPDEQRVVIRLRFFERRSIKESADMLGWTIHAVRSRLRSGLIAMRASLGATSNFFSAA